MTKYGIFLKPEQSIFSNIINEKKQYLNLNNNQNYTTDQPHCTLFHGIFENKEKLLRDFNNIEISKSTKLLCNSVKPIIFNTDVHEGYQTLAYLIEADEEILKVQMQFINGLKPFKSSQHYRLKSEYKKNLITFNYPYVGESLLPHLTITNIQTNEESSICKNFKMNTNSFKGNFASIYIAKIEDGIEILDEKEYVL